MRAHPSDWEERARQGFREHPRAMALPSQIPVIMSKSTPRSRIVHGMFEQQCHVLPDDSVDLVFTSPPYAMQRAKHYGGIAEEDYPRWSVAWMRHARRLLKPSGSVLIVIRPHVLDGRLRGRYVRQTLDALEDDGWNYCDEEIWHKVNAPPVGYVGRKRRAWESVHWFSMSPQPYCDPRATGRYSRRIGLMRSRINIIKGRSDYQPGASLEAREGIARATDVTAVGVGDVDRSNFNTHPAQFPVKLAEHFIRTYCPPEGVVVDPFAGSGSTVVGAVRTRRVGIGFDKEGDYVNIARRRLKETRLSAETTGYLSSPQAP